jgi:magnesium transporter
MLPNEMAGNTSALASSAFFGGGTFLFAPPEAHDTLPHSQPGGTEQVAMKNPQSHMQGGDFATENLAQWFLAQDLETQQKWLSEHHAAEIAEVLDTLETEELRLQFFSLVAPDLDLAADVLAESEEEVSSELLASVPEERASDLLEEMDPDDAADVLGEVREDNRALADRLLEGMEPDEARELENLLQYPEESAGGIMSPDFVALSITMSAQEAINSIRGQVGEGEYFYVFVVDNDNRFQGTVSMHRLISAAPDIRLQDLFSPRQQRAVYVMDDQEKVAELMSRYNKAALPVLNDEGRVVGRVTHDDILDIIEEEDSEDILMMAGTGPDDLGRRGILQSVKLRFPSLMISLTVGFFMCLIIGGFESHLAIPFIMFIPLIPLMSGNAGIQTSTVLIRGLATGQVREELIFRNIFREVRVGLITGICCALISFLAVWGYTSLTGGSSVGVALAVSCSIFLAVCVAAAVGTSIPLLLVRHGFDPAIASGPVITAITDTSSIIIYLLIAWGAKTLLDLPAISS